MHALPLLKRLLMSLLIVGAGFVIVVYAASEWKIQRTYDIPLSPPPMDAEPDLAAGERMAKIVGCWAGCHGVRGEGGVEEIPGIRRITAPPLGSVIPHYTDAELVRLILHGVKRDHRSAIGMSSFTFWPGVVESVIRRWHKLMERTTGIRRTPSDLPQNPNSMS